MSVVAPESLLEAFMVKRLQASRVYLSAEHEALIEAANGQGDATFLIGDANDAPMFEFDTYEWSAPWLMGVEATTPERLDQAGWPDLAALARLALSQGCDQLELWGSKDHPRFPNDTTTLGLTPRKD